LAKQTKVNNMFQANNPSLTAFIATLVGVRAEVEAFAVNNGEGDAVRLVTSQDGIEIIIDIEVALSPDGCGAAHLDPYLTAESRSALVSRGVLPEDRFAAMEQGAQFASALTEAHRALITETARDVHSSLV